MAGRKRAADCEAKGATAAKSAKLPVTKQPVTVNTRSQSAKATTSLKVQEKKDATKSTGSDSTAKVFVCDFDGCGKNYKSQSGLKLHALTHSNEKPFICPEEGCGKRFARKNVLKVHSLTHSDARNFVCNVNGCLKRFTRKDVLKKHQLSVHSDLKPFICPEVGCGKAFKRKSYLTQHAAVHSTEKPFLCPEEGCGKRFARKYVLNEHSFTHSDARNFVCNVNECLKRFSRKDILKNHQLSAHSDLKTFICTEVGCGKAFKLEVNLKHHAAVHSTEKPFLCLEEGCGKRFSRLKVLKEHSHTHSLVKRFKCAFPLCRSESSNRGNALKHIANQLSKKKTEKEIFADKFINDNFDSLNFLLANGIPANIVNKKKEGASKEEQILFKYKLIKIMKCAQKKADNYRKEQESEMKTLIAQEKEQCQKELEKFIDSHPAAKEEKITKALQCDFPLCGATYGSKSGARQHIQRHLDKKKMELELLKDKSVDTNFKPLSFLLFNGEPYNGKMSKEIDRHCKLAKLQNLACKKVENYRKELEEFKKIKVIFYERQFQINMKVFFIRNREETLKLL